MKTPSADTIGSKVQVSNLVFVMISLNYGTELQTRSTGIIQSLEFHRTSSQDVSTNKPVFIHAMWHSPASIISGFKRFRLSVIINFVLLSATNAYSGRYPLNTLSTPADIAGIAIISHAIVSITGNLSSLICHQSRGFT